MKTNKAVTIALAALAAAIFTLVSPAGAVPLNIYTVQDPIQDNWTIGPSAHELGNNFPPNELISSIATTWPGRVPCPTDYQGGPMVLVAMQNLTGQTFYEGQVFYVADTPETSLSNWDEWVGQIGGLAPGKAFMIDRLGGPFGQANTPLMAESMGFDGVWLPNEVWEFVIQDYANSWGGPASLFGSVGLIGGSSTGDPFSTGSIIVVPEPSCAALMMLNSLLCAFWVCRRCR